MGNPNGDRWSSYVVIPVFALASAGVSILAGSLVAALLGAGILSRATPPD